VSLIDPLLPVASGPLSGLSSKATSGLPTPLR
jgi:hypothetical protein